MTVFVNGTMVFSLAEDQDKIEGYWHTPYERLCLLSRNHLDSQRRSRASDRIDPPARFFSRGRTSPLSTLRPS